MIKTYRNKADGRVKVFFAVDDGNVTSITIGNQSVPTEQGFQFYVDDYVAEQIDKCELYLDGLTPKLIVKEGETIHVPDVNNEYLKEKRKQELLEELERLNAE